MPEQTVSTVPPMRPEQSRIDVRYNTQSTSVLDPLAFLANNDSYHFFEPLNALVKTGPTGTNVMDVRAILIDK